MKFLKDLFYGHENKAAELGRILAFVGTLMMLGGQVWNIMLGLPIELGPTGLGGGLAAFYGACAAFIYAKDRASSESKVADAVVDATPSAPHAHRAKAKK